MAFIKEIPYMTSFTHPYGKAIASGSNGHTWAAWQAFDGKLGYKHAWQDRLEGECYIGYSFPRGRIISKYVISSPSFADHAPKSWRFEASNDLVNWVVLDEKTDQEYDVFEGEINNEQEFISYRVFITDTHQERGSHVVVEELTLFSEGEYQTLGSGLLWNDAIEGKPYGRMTLIQTGWVEPYTGKWFSDNETGGLVHVEKWRSNMGKNYYRIID